MYVQVQAANNDQFFLELSGHACLSLAGVSLYFGLVLLVSVDSFLQSLMEN